MSQDRSTNWLIILVVIVLALFLLVPFSMGGYGMMGPWMMGGGLGWSFMFLFPLVFLGLIVFGVYFLVSAPSVGAMRPPPVQSSAIQILNERYARGEIMEEQYVKMKTQLGG